MLFFESAACLLFGDFLQPLFIVPLFSNGGLLAAIMKVVIECLIETGML